MYSFGAPRVGNHNFARDYNIFVPNSFRVGMLFPSFSLIVLVVDGDIVSAVPASGYKHIGTNVILDSKGKGSIIIDPSFVEKYLRMSSKTSIGAHSLYVYRRGLKAVRLATQYLNGQLDETQKRNVFRIDEDHNDVDGIALSQCRSSTMSIDANVMSIAKESSIYVASNLSDDQQDPGLQKQDPEIKKHNQEVSDIDQWATNLQNPSMLEKLFTWIGFGKQNDDIVSDSEVSNTLHLESKE